jgi:hypothetical protein
VSVVRDIEEELEGEMTEQERQMISGLGDRIKDAPAPQIDRDAYDLILHTIGSRPDALYILTQTVLIQEMALNQAKAQIEDLKRGQGSYAGVPQQGGFLPGSYQGSSYAAPPPQTGGGFSGFLHNVATTAAGVIAGEIAFDSLSSLFGGHRGGFFGGGSGFMGGGDTIVNNYGGDQGDSRFAQAADQDQDVSPDIDDERDNSGDDFSGGDDGGSSDS